MSGDCFRKTSLIFWKDKKIIYIISNYYDGQIINTLRLNKKTMKKENINKSYLIEQYNRFMKGVDLMDQYLCLYMHKHRSLNSIKNNNLFNRNCNI